MSIRPFSVIKVKTEKKMFSQTKWPNIIMFGSVDLIHEFTLFLAFVQEKL